MSAKGIIKNLSVEVIRKYPEAFIRIASDLPHEYWKMEHFLKALPKKWELSFYVMVDGKPNAYTVASHQKGNYHIHHFMVAKNFRGQSIGSMMLAEAQKRAESNGISRLTLKVFKNDLNAQAFYLRNGFRICQKDVGKGGDYLFLEKQLAYERIVAIHQPNYIPWPGYFYKIEKADLFIFLDNVEFSKNGYINRNKIKNVNGPLWLTIPVRAKSKSKIVEVKFGNEIWRKKHIKTLSSSYGRSACASSILPWFREILENEEFDNIADLNIHIIKAICNKLNVIKNFVRSSQLNVEGKGDDLLISLVKAVNGSCYLSGYGGSKYQDPEKFAKSGLGFKYYSYNPPTYPQLWGEFIPNLSILDVLFNIGIDGTISLLKS